MEVPCVSFYFVLIMPRRTINATSITKNSSKKYVPVGFTQVTTSKDRKGKKPSNRKKPSVVRRGNFYVCCNHCEEYNPAIDMVFEHLDKWIYFTTEKEAKKHLETCHIELEEKDKEHYDKVNTYMDWKTIKQLHSTIYSTTNVMLGKYLPYTQKQLKEIRNDLYDTIMKRLEQ